MPAPALVGTPRDPRHRTRQPLRRGAVATEAALVAPLLIVVLFGAVDIGQYVNVAQSISNASREGARIASRDRTTNTSAVQQAVWAYFAQTFPNLNSTQIQAATTVTVRDETSNVAVSGDMSTLTSGSPISVTVQFNFRSVRWLPGIDWWNLSNKQTKTIVRRE